MGAVDNNIKKVNNMISVIIPVYNTGKYLKKCVCSIMNQTYNNLQIILVNDGSTDDSPAIMAELKNVDSRIVIIDRKHEGVSAARNAGIEAATGDFISFIDSDDWLEPNTYQIILGILKENDADAVYYEWMEEYSDGTSTAKGHDGKKKIVLSGDKIIQEFLKNNRSFRLSSGLLKSTLLRNVSFEVGRNRGEDMLVAFLTIVNTNRIVYVDIPLYHRFHRVGSLSNQKTFDSNDFGRATGTDVMVEYLRQNKPQFLQNAYCYSFNTYMIVLNQISYYRCEQEYAELYAAIRKRLKELWKLIDSPIKNLSKELVCAYMVFLMNKTIYHYTMVIYYRYVKKELGGKRQR